MNVLLHRSHCVSLFQMHCIRCMFPINKAHTYILWYSPAMQARTILCDLDCEARWSSDGKSIFRLKTHTHTHKKKTIITMDVWTEGDFKVFTSSKTLHYQMIGFFLFSHLRCWPRHLSVIILFCCCCSFETNCLSNNISHRINSIKFIKTWISHNFPHISFTCTDRMFIFFCLFIYCH